MMTACVDVAAKDLMHAALEKYALLNDSYDEEVKTIISPEKTMSSTTVVVSPSDDAPPVAAVPLLDTETIALESDDDDLSTASATTADEFLSAMKEEAVLQTLLHKRIHEKKERVFQLEHRNGRRLLVVLPPDPMSISAFVEEAKRTAWVDIMLKTAC